MNPERFIKAYDEYSDAIFRYGLFRVYNREQAQELMQETFYKAWKYLNDGHQVDQLKPFLYKIMNNLIIDHLRKEKKTTSLDDLLEQGFEVGEDKTDSLKSGLDAKDALYILKKLKKEFREVVVLRYVQDLSLKQIAQVLGIQENLVSVRLNRALKELRKLLSHG